MLNLLKSDKNLKEVINILIEEIEEIKKKDLIYELNNKRNKL